MKKLLFCVLLSPLFASANLKLTLSTPIAILIDTPAVSCMEHINSAASGKAPNPDLAPLHFGIHSITMDWSGAQPLLVHYVRVNLHGLGLNGGAYKSVIAGDQLTFTHNGSAGSGIFIAPNSTSTNICSYKFGGVNLSDKTRDQSGLGTIEVFGTYTDSSGIVNKVVQSVGFQWEFAASQ